MTIAETAATLYDDDQSIAFDYRHRMWTHLGTWATELGLSRPEALFRASIDPREAGAGTVNNSALMAEVRAVHAGHGDPEKLVNAFHESTVLIHDDHIASQLMDGGEPWMYLWSTVDHLAAHCGPARFYTALGADIVNHIVPALLAALPERSLTGLYIDADTPHWIALPIQRPVAITGQDVTPIRSRHTRAGQPR
jgi:hypothetical protein